MPDQPRGRGEDSGALDATVTPLGAPDASLATLDVSAAQLPAAGALAADDLPEVRAARYRMAEEVGRGGLGRVLRARDVVLGRTVAIKELHADDEGARRRFVREALITARLQHPSIVPVYEAGRWPDRAPFYAMKLVSGRPLSDVLDSKRSLRERLALIPTVLAVADAIAYAHSERIVHRDLKPHNVLVGAFGETVVIDWGLAKDLSIEAPTEEDGPYRAAASADQTVAGAVMGTPAYMAPEQAAGEAVDERTDVYAIGAMLYHVIAGVPPHGGRAFDQVLAQILAGDIVPLSSREPEVPHDLAAVVAKAMALAPADRYRSAAELADDLRRFTSGQLVGAHRYTVAERVRRWIRRHRAVTAVAAVAVAVLAVFATWSLRRIFLEIDRADRERDTAVAASTLAEQRRDQAVAEGNRAVISQARAALDDDAAVALAWLRRLAVDGPGWSAARMIAADALDRPRLQRRFDGAPLGIPSFSPDGRWVAMPDIIDLAQIWVLDLQTGTARDVAADFLSDMGMIWCDDGRHLLVRARRRDDDDAQVQPTLIDLTTGTAEMGDPSPQSRALTRGACAASWRFMDLDGALVWSDGVTMRTVGPSVPDSLVISEDGARAAGVDAAGMLRWWDATGVIRQVVLEPGRQVVASTADATLVGSLAPTVILVRVGDGKPLRLRERVGRSMAFSGDGRWVAVSDVSAGIDFYDTTTGIRLGGLDTDGVVARLALSRDGRYLIGEGAPLRVWDLWGAATALPLTGSRQLEYGVLGPRGLISAQYDSYAVRRWSLPDPVIRPFPIDGLRPDKASLSPDGRWAAVELHVEAPGGTRKEVRRLDLTGATPDEVLAEMPGAVSDGGTPLPRATVAIWNDLSVQIEADGLRVGDRRIPLDDGGLATVAVSDDQRWIAVGRYEGPVDLIDTTTWEVRRLAGSFGRAVGFGVDGWLATGGDGGALLVWDPRTWASRELGRSDDAAVSAALSPDLRWAVFGGEEWFAIVARDGGAPRRLRRHKTFDASAAVAFAPTGDTVITRDGTVILLIDAASGERREIAVAGWDGPLAFRATANGIVVVTEYGILRIRDDLPRDPAGLAAVLAALPYDLDADDRLVVRSTD